MLRMCKLKMGGGIIKHNVTIDNLPLRKKNFRVSSTREYQELTKYPALSHRSDIIPLRDAEDVQTEDEVGKIKHNVTIDNDEMSTGKVNVLVSTNAGSENKQISSSKFNFLVSNTL